MHLKNLLNTAFSFFQNNRGDGNQLGIMTLVKNGVVVSYSRASGSEDNLFGTAILNLAVGDLVSPFNCMMQIQYTYTHPSNKYGIHANQL